MLLLLLLQLLLLQLSWLRSCCCTTSTMCCLLATARNEIRTRCFLVAFQRVRAHPEALQPQLQGTVGLGDTKLQQQGLL
jgi:hypothetical protein